MLAHLQLVSAGTGAGRAAVSQQTAPAANVHTLAAYGEPPLAFVGRAALSLERVVEAVPAPH